MLGLRRTSTFVTLNSADRRRLILTALLTIIIESPADGRLGAAIQVPWRTVDVNRAIARKRRSEPNTTTTRGTLITQTKIGPKAVSAHPSHNCGLQGAIAKQPVLLSSLCSEYCNLYGFYCQRCPWEMHAAFI